MNFNLFLKPAFLSALTMGSLFVTAMGSTVPPVTVAEEAPNRAERQQCKQDEEKQKNDAWFKTPLGMKFAKVQELIKKQEYAQALRVYDEIASSEADSRITDPKLAAAHGKSEVYRKMGNMDGYYENAKIVFRAWSRRAQELIDQGMGLNAENGSMSELSLIAFGMNNTFSWRIADPDSKLPRRDFDFAIEVAQRTVEITHRKNGEWLDTLAWAYFGKGDIEKAIATEKEAIGLCEGAIPSEWANALKKFEAARTHE